MLSSFKPVPVRAWWLAGLCLLALGAGCGRDEAALSGAATEPAAAVRQLATYLEQGDLAGFARAAVPPAQHAALASAWADGDSLWPLTGLPLDEHLPDLLAALAADGAETDLRRAFRAQLAGQTANVRQTAHSLGLFGAQYVAQQGDYSQLQREHYRQLVLALSRWASQAPLSDPDLARQTIDRLTRAVRESGLDGEPALRAAGMEPALQALAPVQQAFMQVLAAYGLDLGQSLQGLRTGLIAQDGDSAQVRVQYALAGNTVDFTAELVRLSGRWYMAQNLADANAALDAAAAARGKRQAQAAASAERADGATMAADPRPQDAKTAAGP